jgi:hypothetical protein
MVLALEEKISLAAWWTVALGITLYLLLSVVNTIIVVAR